MGNIRPRHSDTPLVGDCITLDLAWIMRLAPIREGQAGYGAVNWHGVDNAIGTLRFRLDLREAATARLILRFRITTPNGNLKPMQQVIALTSSLQHFGGRRWWMRCPVTGQRVRVLHLPPGEQRFAGRNALGLAYRVERLSRFDRPFEKLFRAQLRIGGTQGLDAGFERPKGMWKRTFARYITAVEQHDVACVEQIAALINKS